MAPEIPDPIQPTGSLMTQRNLTLHSLDELRQQLQLLESGYRSNGNWNLAQCCEHLECWMRYPMDGFPRAPLPIALMMSVVGKLFGRSMFRKMLKIKKMRAGMPTAPETVFKSDSSADRDAVERLRKTIDRFEQWNGPVHRSPLFGNMDRAECEQLQLVHCAHHLSFLEPSLPQS